MSHSVWPERREGEKSWGSEQRGRGGQGGPAFVGACALGEGTCLSRPGGICSQDVTWSDLDFRRLSCHPDLTWMGGEGRQPGGPLVC